MIRRETVETYFFFALVGCCVLAFFTWLAGMVRPKGFGTWPAALYVALLVIALLCSGVVGLLEFAH